MSQVNYVTKDTFEKMQTELQHMKGVQRPAASKAIGEAREKGDLRVAFFIYWRPVAYSNFAVFVERARYGRRFVGIRLYRRRSLNRTGKCVRPNSRYLPRW